MGRPDGLGQLVNRDIFEQVADSSCKHGILHEVLVFETGQGDDLYLGPLLADGTGCGYPIHAGHDQVHQDHIGLKSLAQF